MPEDTPATPPAAPPTSADSNGAQAPPAAPGEPPQGAGVELPEPPSILEELRARRDKIGEERRIMIDVAGYGGKLVAEYKPMPYRDLRKAQKRASKKKGGDEADVDINFAAGVLINACSMMYVRLAEDSEPVPLHEQVESFGDEPVLWDQRLAKALKVEASSALVLVRMVFNNSYALADHYRQYDEWLRESEPDEDF